MEDEYEDVVFEDIEYEEYGIVRPSIALVDFENVGELGLKRIVEIANKIYVQSLVVFYSSNNKNITLDTMKELLDLGIKLDLKKVNVGGKNALDFQLSSYLGYLVGTHDKDVEYYIVSNDKGFDYVASFWDNVFIKRIDTNPNQDNTIIASEKLEPPQKSNTKSKVTLEELQSVLSSKDNPDIILIIFNRHTQRRNIINDIQRYFHNSQKAGDIYRKIKPLLDEYNK